MNNEVEKKEYEKYLPIGTVVLLKGGKKRVMITGFCCYGNNENEKKIFDYQGCLFPEGMITANKLLLFNHEQIQDVYYLGCIDEEEKNFKQKLNAVIQKLEENKTNL